MSSISPRATRSSSRARREKAPRKDLALFAYSALDPLWAYARIPSTPAERTAHRRIREHLLDARFGVDSIEELQLPMLHRLCATLNSDCRRASTLVDRTDRYA